jgi:hypothetical protein
MRNGLINFLGEHAYRYGYTTKNVQIIDMIKETDMSLFEKNM